MTLQIEGVDHARTLVGHELGVGSWIHPTQDRVDAFADATGDHQWIHVDPVRAGASPLGTTIAHGRITLALGAPWAAEIFAFGGFSFSLNDGYDKVRFPAPVPVDSRVRMRATLLSVGDIPGGIQTTVRQTFGIEREPKPACVAESVSRHVG